LEMEVYSYVCGHVRKQRVWMDHHRGVGSVWRWKCIQGQTRGDQAGLVDWIKSSSSKWVRASHEVAGGFKSGTCSRRSNATRNATLDAQRYRLRASPHSPHAARSQNMGHTFATLKNTGGTRSPCSPQPDCTPALAPHQVAHRQLAARHAGSAQ